MIHISNTDKDAASQTLCGKIGRGVYDPTTSDCDDCIAKFKELYPEGYRAWQQKREGGSSVDVDIALINEKAGRNYGK